MLSLKRNLGFTALELLITILIIIIVTIIAVPTFITFFQNTRLKNTADNLFIAAQYARSEAIKRNATVFVSIQTGDDWCYGFNTGSACNCSTAGNCNLGSAQAPQEEQLTFNTSGISSGNFQIEGGRGTTNVSNGRIQMQVFGQSTTITLLVSQIGNFQLCSSLSGYDPCP